ncbi:MAG: hypothetical protein ACO24D_19075 [bacterium]
MLARVSGHFELIFQGVKMDEFFVMLSLTFLGGLVGGVIAGVVVMAERLDP